MTPYIKFKCKHLFQTSFSLVLYVMYLPSNSLFLLHCPLSYSISLFFPTIFYLFIHSFIYLLFFLLKHHITLISQSLPWMYKYVHFLWSSQSSFPSFTKTLNTKQFLTMPSNLKIQLFLGLLLFLGLVKPDPQPLQDYCIADTSSPHSFYFDGPPCMNPNLASPSHFATSALSRPGNTSANKFGFSVILTNNQNLPGHRTQGLSMARIDIAPNGLVPPHSHPRASEVTTCIKGDILVGFVDTSNKMYTQRLRAGESFVFPKGLIHFLYNVDQMSPALAVSGLSSESPGAQIASIATFTSNPAMPDVVLEKAFKIDGQEVARIRHHLEG